MLRTKELTAAVKLEQAVGRRRYGHFDYDAHKAIGPDPAYSSVSRRQTKRVRSASAQATPPLRLIDKRTGRITYKPAI